MIRSKINYGSIIYQSAIRTPKELNDHITTKCLRIASGAFKFRPIESIQSITNEMPLDLRRDQLTLKYFIKIKSNFANPALYGPTNRSPTYKKLKTFRN